ncbi:MAG: hypothetical protein WAP03_22130 [Methylorubrum rhodinum]|uniref:hypothetical protein n=1 Tax=Methylorubrum rhodinum TaxID=29428 RepID=UPI003BB1E76E
MASLDRIPLQAASFRTSQVTDWLDGLPLVAVAGSAGIVAGIDNRGNGGVTIASIAPTTEPGAHVATVAGIKGGQTYVTVTDPRGGVTEEGVVGLPLDAAGIVFTLAQGSTPFAVGDTFALAILPAPLDVTPFVFELRATLDSRSLTVMLQASSAPPDGATPTILTGTGGTVAMRLLRPAMSRCPPGDYPYALIATDPTTGLSAPAFVGTIRHRATPTLQD